MSENYDDVFSNPLCSALSLQQIRNIDTMKKNILNGDLWQLPKNNCWSGFKWNCCGSVFRNRKISDKETIPTPVLSVTVLPVDSIT